MTTYHRSGYGESNSTFALVTINGKEISKKHGITIHIHQSMLEHTTFELHCPSEAFSDKITYPLKNSINLLGTDITVLFRKQGGNESLFTGFVTHVSYKKNNKYPFIVISGKSYSALLDSQKFCRTYHNKTLKDILQEAFKEYTGSKVDFICQPNKTEIIPYTISYNETLYEFIQRLAKRYGEYLFWNGSQLVFGRGNQKKIELKEGRDYLEYNIEVGVAPQHLIYENYNHQVAEVQSLQSKPAGTHVNLFQEKAVDIAHKVYTQLPTAVYYDTLSEEQNTVQEQKLEAYQKALENLVIITAQTTHAKLRLGDIAKLLAYIPEFERQKATGTPIESYLITQIEHTYTAKGYTNQFTAIPREQEIAPYWDMKAYPIAEDQSAVVVENNDPLKQNRIKVQFYWQKLTNETTPWIRLIQGHGGNGQGMHIIPEIGHEVQIAFRGNNAEVPLVTGSLYNGKQNSGYSSQNNDLKVLHTRSGTKRIANDAEGSILEQDAAGSFIKWEGDGKIHIKAQNIIVDANNITFNATNNINLNVTNHMICNVMTAMYTFTPYFQQKVRGDMIFTSNTSLFSSKTKMNLEAQNLIALGSESLFAHSDKKTTINSKKALALQGEEGNELSNKAQELEKTPVDEITDVIVAFRTDEATYDGEFGFDWLRIDEVGTSEIAYEKILDRAYKNGIEDFTMPEAYNELIKEYDKEKIPIKRTNASVYYVPCLNLFPEDISQATNVPSGMPKPSYKASLRMLIDIEKNEPKEIKIEFKKEYFKINDSSEPYIIKDKVVGNQRKASDGLITITCISELKNTEYINVYAYSEQTPIPQLAGRIAVLPNDAKHRKTQKFLQINIKTNIDGKNEKEGTISNNELAQLYKSLYQALIIPEIEIFSGAYDLTQVNEFRIITDKDGNQTIGKFIIFNSLTQMNVIDCNKENEKMKSFLKDKFLNDHSQYANYFLIFVFGEFAINDVLGFIYNIGVKCQFIFLGAPDYYTLAHEALHGLGLWHTFTDDPIAYDKNQKYIFKKYNDTTNIMSYNDYNMKSSWYWQWTIMHKNIN